MTTTNPESDDDVHRLIDMVVEEVSLVDRAANQRRFLLVKRSQAVTTENDPNDTPDDDVDAEPTPDADTDDGGEGSPQGGSDSPDSPPPVPSGASTEAVVAALEALTGVVEVLATQTTEKAKKPAKPQIDDEEDLQDGGADEAEEDAEPDVAEEDTPPPPRRGPPPKKKTKAAGGDALAEVRAQLARIENALGRRPAKKQESPAPNGITARLADVAKMLGELKTQIGGQAGRLAKVEKHIGAPASKPVDGPPRKGGDSDVSWPLDINAPRDRESVAKDMSFH